MGKVINLNEFSSSRAIERGLTLWRKSFPENLTSRTRLSDLSDQTILTLAQLGHGAMAILYNLIMGVFDLGPYNKFQYLSGEPKMKVLEASLFLVDQIRWECMRRLGWVEGFAGEKYPLVHLIMKYRTLKSEFNPPFPGLKKNQPRYEEFIKRREVDGEAMIRGLIPIALAAFSQKV